LGHELVAAHAGNSIEPILNEDFLLDLCCDVIGRPQESPSPGQIHHEGPGLNRFPNRGIAAHDLKQRFFRRADSRGIWGEDVQAGTDPSGLLDGHADPKTFLLGFSGDFTQERP